MFIKLPLTVSKKSKLNEMLTGLEFNLVNLNVSNDATTDTIKVAYRGGWVC